MVSSNDNSRVNSAAAVRADPVTHYENFPVASLLCPPRLRPAVAAIYWFARTADDIADEGDAAAEHRLADLAAFRAELSACLAGDPVQGRWPRVFKPLQEASRRFALPAQPLHDLVSAFEQDVRKTRDGAGYADRDELLDYCSRSANPVGRLMLHLYGVDDPFSLRQSDCVCSALQLINFWQDLGVDIPRRRFYLPDADLAAHGVRARTLADLEASPSAARLVEAEVAWARDLMRAGMDLALRVPGRAGWELRLVTQGGLRILDRIAALGFTSWRQRPKLGIADALPIAWLALWMRPRTGIA